MAVPGADELVPVLNRYLARARRLDMPVFASRDWHPPNHRSFRERGGPWPRHCVAGTSGASFRQELELPCDVVVVSKGAECQRDGYSAFDGTDLERRLRDALVERLFVGGVATEYCVCNTVCAALERGFGVTVLHDAIRAIDAAAGRRAEAAMAARGASFTSWTALAA